MSGSPPAAPEGGFVLALVVGCDPVELAYRAYSCDFDPADVLKGAQGKYTPFDENAADSMLVHGLGHERTTAWELFDDDGCRGVAEWAAVIQPAGGPAGST